MMETTKTNQENTIGKIVFDFFTEKLEHFEEGLPTVGSKSVQNYLDEFEGMKRAILDAAKAKDVDLQLLEIIERFMNLTEERNADGTIDRRTLLFHIRLSERLGFLLLHDSSTKLESEIMEICIHLDFNKESVCNYYRQEVPRMKANGILKHYHPELKEMNDQITKLYLNLAPGDIVTYEVGAKSLKECVEEVVGSGML